jgi:GT2 family glycosyltransferase
MKLGTLIVTYDRPAHLKESVELLLRQTLPANIIVIVDNGTAPETKKVVQNFSPQQVVYQSTGENLGSAGGTAYGVEWLYEQGCDLIHCGDDDDPPKTADTLERLVTLIEKSGTDVGGVGAVGSRFDWHKGQLQRLPDEALRGVVEVDMVGGNGHLIVRRETVRVAGPPERRLFFGYPDLEYCLRIRQAGYRLLVDGELMHQYRAQAGRLNLERRRNILPPRPYNHIWRNYYTTRSYIFMMRHKFNRPDLARREALKALGRTVTSWARGPKYGAAFTGFQLRGIFDGYFGRMGRTIMPNPKHT